MGKIIYATLLAIIVIAVSCKKKDDEKQKDPINYKVKSDEGYTYDYNGEGLLSKCTEFNSIDTVTRWYNWKTDSLIIVIQYSRGGQNIESYPRNAAGYVMPGQFGGYWVYDAEYNIISSDDSGEEIKYTWVGGNCVKKVYNGSEEDIFEYSGSGTELNTLDFGLKYFPFRLRELGRLPSRNVLINSWTRYGNGIYSYVRDGKGRITEKTTILIDKNGLYTGKNRYNYFD